jgi:hypothetical protein
MSLTMSVECNNQAGSATTPSLMMACQTATSPINRMLIGLVSKYEGWAD